MEQRRVCQTGTRGCREEVSASAAEAEKLIKESAQSTRKLGVNGSERKSRAQRAKDDVFHEVAGRAETHCMRSWRSTRPIHNDQEQ